MPKAVVITVLVSLLLAPSVQGQDAAGAEAAYLKEFKHAQEQTYGCFGAKEPPACLEMIQAYERAMAAPDATEAVRHHIFKSYIHAITIFGANTREAGDPQAALDILGQAFAAVTAHYDDGKHFHTLIDNLRLQQEVALTLAELGRLAEADTVLKNARGAADRVHNARAEFEGADEKQKELLYAAYLGSEALETTVATYFKDQSHAQADADDDASAQASRDRAIAAYQRAHEWLQRKHEAGIRSSMDVRYEIRYSEIQVELGAMYMNSGREKEAEEAFGFAGLSCSLLDTTSAAQLGVRPAEGIEVPLLQPICERAMLGWGLTSGAVDKILEQAFDRLLDPELKYFERIR